jgi:hypothetical protein
VNVKKFGTALAVSVGIMAFMTVMAGASGVRTVELRDKCDPATFNAAIGPGTCVGDGDVTFQEFLAQLNPVDFGHDAWRMQFGRGRIDQGETLRATNDGGEFHTFTEVANFGGGCVDLLNGPLGLTPVPECAPVTEVAPGTFVPTAFITSGLNPRANLDVSGLQKTGSPHKFQCLIHPWMRLEVEVR